MFDTLKKIVRELTYINRDDMTTAERNTCELLIAEGIASWSNTTECEEVTLCPIKFEDEDIIVKVMSSPHEEDTDLPWEYNESAFIGWYSEVFQESYKRDVAQVDTDQAVQHLLELGYTVATRVK